MHLLVIVRFCVDYGTKYTFTGGWGGWVGCWDVWQEKWGLKLTFAKVEVEVEAGLGKKIVQYIKNTSPNYLLSLLGYEGYGTF